jgi:hypothetical protein
MVRVTGLLAYGGLINVKLFKVKIEGDELVLCVKLPNSSDPSIVDV